MAKGNHVIYFNSTDNLGNIELMKSIQVSIDEEGEGEEDIVWMFFIILIIAIIVVVVLLLFMFLRKKRRGKQLPEPRDPLPETIGPAREMIERQQEPPESDSGNGNVIPLAQQPQVVQPGLQEPGQQVTYAPQVSPVPIVQEQHLEIPK